MNKSARHTVAVAFSFLGAAGFFSFFSAVFFSAGLSVALSAVFFSAGLSVALSAVFFSVFFSVVFFSALESDFLVAAAGLASFLASLTGPDVPG